MSEIRSMSLLLLIVGMLCGTACGQEEDKAIAKAEAYILNNCLEASAAKYWLFDFHQGVEQLAGANSEIIRWRGRKTFGCFETPREAVERSEPATGHPGPKTEGSVAALWNLAPSFGTNDEKRKTIEALLGMRFESEEAFGRWLDENLEFLRWSEPHNHLVVDEQSKQVSSKIIDLNPTFTFTPDEFWYREGLGDLIGVSEAGGKVEGWFVTGDVHRPRMRFEAPPDVLSDLEGKERGYRRAADKLVRELQWWHSRNEELDAGLDEAQSKMRALEAITRKDFADPTEWINWWILCGDRLALEPQGERLLGSGECF